MNLLIALVLFIGFFAFHDERIISDPRWPAIDAPGGGTPAALAGLKAGDYVLQIDGRPVAPPANVDQLLDHTIGKRVVLSVSSAGAAARDVVVKPIDQQTERGLRYRQWVEEKRAYGAKASGGKLGYVHMYDMHDGAEDDRPDQHPDRADERVAERLHLLRPCGR